MRNSPVLVFRVAVELLERFPVPHEEPKMAISHELEAQILRYFHAEKWRVGTVAHQLNIHHSVVTRDTSRPAPPNA
jgi:hypothetical protein